MQPAQASGTGGSSGGNRQLRRWGPIVGIAAVVAVAIIVVVATSGGKNDGSAGTSDSTGQPATPSVADTAPDATTPDATTPGSGGTNAGTTVPPPADITFPMTFQQATDQGVADQIDWGARCDTTTGQIAVPDFFAQPCMAPFTGDNGGATDTGVTVDEITLVFYQAQEADPIIAYITDAISVDETNAQQFDQMDHIVSFYETYFELYGRKVKLIDFEGTGGSTDDVAARADAARIAEQYKPFAVFNGPALTSGFADELAARQILCIGCTPGQPDQFYADRDPYVWSLDGSQAQKQTHAVEFISKQLIGHNATHGGDGVVDQPRTFGLLYLESSAASKALADQYVADMAAAGAPFAEVIAYALDPSSIQATASQAISKLKAAGVTTVVFSGDPVAPRDFTREATAQEYFPEWFISASGLVDTNAFARTYDQAQWAHAFGVTQGAVRVDPETIGYFSIYKWFTGQDPPAPANIALDQPAPALFFAVAQAVGPNLTHETWRDALFAAGGTKAAVSQPYLSWGTDLWPYADYLGLDDATAFWWDPTTVGPDEIRKEAAGMYQFVDGGKRYLPGEWPTVDKMFEPAGAVAMYTTPPPGEAPPSYPSPAGGS
jgi:hypothetical protein